jgi:hypothetical protein
MKKLYFIPALLMALTFQAKSASPEVQECLLSQLGALEIARTEIQSEAQKSLSKLTDAFEREAGRDPRQKAIAAAYMKLFEDPASESQYTPEKVLTAKGKQEAYGRRLSTLRYLEWKISELMIEIEENMNHEKHVNDMRLRVDISEDKISEISSESQKFGIYVDASTCVYAALNEAQKSNLPLESNVLIFSIY